MARMRVEIAKGFKQSMESMAAGGLSPQEAMNMMITTQYVDTLKDFATNPNKTAVMMPLDDPNKDMEAKVRDGFVSDFRLHVLVWIVQRHHHSGLVRICGEILQRV